MTGGSLAFPTRYRGLATTLMLTMFDLGNLVGQPAVGTILKMGERMGWPPYPTMFLSVALLMLTVLGIYGLSSRVGRTSGQAVVGTNESTPARSQPSGLSVPDAVACRD